jgi:hypothetical protein
MLVNRPLDDEGRPPWCITKIVNELDRYFEESELRGVKESVLTYRSRNAVLFRRLKNMTEEECLSTSQDSREKKRGILHEFKVAEENIRRMSRYG